MSILDGEVARKTYEKMGKLDTIICYKGVEGVEHSMQVDFIDDHQKLILEYLSI